MRESLAKQLANLIGRKNIEPERNSTNSEKLRALYRLLEQSHEKGFLQERRTLTRLAIECGKETIYPRLRSEEEFFANLALEYIWDSTRSYPISEKLLATASLSNSKTSKRLLRRQILKIESKGLFHQKLINNGLQRKQQDFILNRADKTLLKKIKERFSAAKARKEEKERARDQELNNLATAKKSARREQLKRLNTTVSGFFNQLIDFRTEPNLANIGLDASDLELVYIWSNGHSDPPSTMEDLFTKSLSNYDTCRLLSARIAEKAATRFYRGLNATVTDESIMQISGGATNWLDFDLSADSKKVDVKNARRSFTSSDNYSEQFVKEWKLSGDQNVTILGTLSDYVVRDKFLASESGDVLVLGEVTREKIKRLETWVNHTYSEILDANFADNRSFLPGWMYEFPPTYYQNRNHKTGVNIENFLSSLSEGDAQIDDYSNQLVLDSDVPRWLLGLTEKWDLAQHFLSDPEEIKIWHSIQESKKHVGINRRMLYLLILASVLSRVADHNATFSPELWQKFLFSDKNNSSYYPLGLHDPQAQIFNLIKLLSNMWARNRQELSNFTLFKLSSPNVLRGRNKDGKWKTIFAFCGGWLGDPYPKKCGKNPIYLGESSSCETCGKLSCSECDHCDDNCPDNKNTNRREYSRRRKI